MLLELLKRDLRLHRMFLILPGLLLAMMAGYGAHRVSTMVNQAIGIAIVTLLLPLSFHLRERSEGTLSTVATFPLPRTHIVQLRFLEAITLPVAAMIALALVSYLVQAFRSEMAVPPLELLRTFGEQGWTFGWVLFWGFAYWLPSTLRWDGKGLGLTLALTTILQLGYGVLMIMAFNGVRPAVWLSAHAHRLLGHVLVVRPWNKPVLLLALLSLSYVLSQRAFRSKDL